MKRDQLMRQGRLEKIDRIVSRSDCLRGTFWPSYLKGSAPIALADDNRTLDALDQYFHVIQARYINGSRRFRKFIMKLL